MAFHMIDADERFIQSKAQRFGCCYTDEEGADETRSIGDANMVNRLQTDLGFIQGFFDNRHNIFDMLARRDFRYDTTKFSMYRYLCRNDIRKDVTAVFNDSSRRFITARFQC